ncbi:cupredoxin family protein [Luteimonas sp. FCS-9]|uniref:cupredoxin domain-containing protein n=1 Tax=Luteimonas sp. FCS-9 TaxID=1547516 RepID=UPI00063E8A32|nr:cupredoxin family protein [Luteimonas sp. FCS-9]KLJ02388.1 copper-binding protein [Luteimonas sp. FCS-9]
MKSPIAAVVALACAASGGALAHGAHGFAFGQPAPAAKARRTVEIDMDEMRFAPDTLAVEDGQTVRFVVRNRGRLLHEFNLGDAALHAAHRQEMLDMLQAGTITGTAIASHGAHDDPNSVLVAPGRTGELVWRFTGPGELEIACNLPGHAEAGMVGRLRID